MPRFVVLYHEMPADAKRSSHWDFMLEQGDVLLTWALEIEPDIVDEQIARKLDDHRLAYLDYEGPVSGNRGSVTRWDSGNYKSLEQSEDRLLIDAQGNRLAGQIELIRDSNPQASGRSDQPWRIRIDRKLTLSTSAPLR